MNELTTNKPARIKLTLKQTKFCQLFTSSDINFFGNATRCYAEAYGIDITTKEGEANASASSSRLLTNAKVEQRIATLLEKQGLSDSAVDAQHFFLIRQNVDLKTKMTAIKEYNRMRSRGITQGKNEPKGNTTNILINAGDKDTANDYVKSFVDHMKQATKAENTPEAEIIEE